ncbi:AmmeMemoRadiSam system protein B [Desulfococcaceae bacterium HSG9]|nr:AmmeMemoRadiSam system protein B [Desulfococcaceae bacterium HSG9]
MRTRKALFSGSWYPGNASECERQIKAFIKETQPVISDRQLTGGIVPHAGWFFSGEIACNVIHQLKSDDPPDVLIVFGMHLHSGSSNYIMTQDAWETPFGTIEIESQLAGVLANKFSFEIETAEHFHQDNTIELQLPFIKYFFPDAKIVPIGVPPNDTAVKIGRAAAVTASELGLKTKVIGSTDLTHYGANYGFTSHGTGSQAVEWVRNENDRGIIDAMLAMDSSQVIREARENQNSCCSGAVAATLAAAKQLGAEKAEMNAYATSYDKSPGDSFVGYVGIVLF